VKFCRILFHSLCLVNPHSRPIGYIVTDGLRALENRLYWSILIVMAENLLEFAQKMAQAARAGLAIERKRLKEILAERQRKQPAQPSQQSR